MNNRSVNDIGGNEFVGHSVFDKIISIENLYGAWREFKRGKTSKKDVLCFEFNLEDNLFNLAEELKLGNYLVEKYDFFYVRDPKLRPIHKASVRDRVVFQAVFRVLYPVFDKQFIHDSCSCRYKKGIHFAVARLRRFCAKVSNNYHQQAFALKCDVKKFFYSIDHVILKKLIKRNIEDTRLLHLIDIIVDSFSVAPEKGLPLGNVTSQLFANIYLNELDIFIKHELHEKFYLRYCDDFIILSESQSHLFDLIPIISEFLSSELKLKLHPGKVQLKKMTQGIDFLGYVTLPYYGVLRTKTKQRMFRKVIAASEKLDADLIDKIGFNQVLQSYLGILQHCQSFWLQQELLFLCGECLAETQKS
ncbi:MAG: Retron-type reverse transcriptase [Parcubacteria group bacterium GW2011_GWC2_39_14]|nr:MAG: Retron-type reverse transcriptase [Parcubacteria group bacterium GW2011_GWC2_39_14]KKR55137.1 MAG: Retron-type reverse transcriptase [Parcubacteria group bacterium GW2011_GWA2_40_23]